MKRLLGLFGLAVLWMAASAPTFLTNDFYVIDVTDQTKTARFSNVNIQTNGTCLIVWPSYGGGTPIMPIGEGNNGDVMVSQGAGANPGWVANTYLTTVGGGSLTAGRVPIAASATGLTDDADLAFATDSLTSTRIQCPKTLRVGGSNATTSIPLTITAVGSQAADLSDWLDSGGVMRSRVDASGGFNYAKVNATGQTADITTTNFNASMQAGQYRIDAYIEDTATDVTAGIVTVTFAWTDDVGATTDATLTQDLSGVGARRNQLSRTVYLASGNLTYATAHTGIFGTATYALRFRVTYLGS